ncbi:MAG: MFS transporter [Polyangiaceae bacterium]|nr:MFS transporter [Polyangiaceae bacterium]
MATTRAAAALGYPAFRRFQLGRLVATLGVQMQGVAVGWQVYAITGEPLHLGYVGLAQFLPALLLTLPAGDLADRLDRRRVLVASYLVQAGCSAALCAMSFGRAPSVLAIYVVLAAIGTARAFAGPAGQALVPNLVAPEHFPNAVAWGSSIWHAATVAGPALGGVAYAWAGGAAEVYGAAFGLELLAALALVGVRVAPRVVPHEAGSWRRLAAGLRYVWRRKIILGALGLDMFAVLLGGAVALVPVFARDILEAGPIGLGMLRSAPAAGATVMALWLAVRPVERRGGAKLLVAVGVFGLATVGFGLSRSLPLSLALLVLAGAADMVSVFVRHAVVQLATPDAMRGRVSAVNLVFIGASNELGEFESGVTAAWLGTEPAVVLGGAGTCLVVALFAWLFPALRRVDALTARALADPADAPPPA